MPSGEVAVDTAGVVLLARHVPFDDQASSFTCSNPTLVDVWNLCKHSVKATSFTGVYIDGVRELKPYEGDAYINMLSHYGVAANPPIARYTHEYLLDNHTWPWEYPVMSILMAWEDYMESGDDSSIRENYSKLKACVQVGDSEGLAEGAMVDWPRSIRNLYYEGGGRNSVTSGWIYRHLNVWAAIEELMGNHEQAEHYRTRAELTKRKMVEKLFDPNRGLYTDAERSDNVSVYGNAYPLAFGCFPEEHIPGVVTFLKARGMQCNVFAAQFLLDGLFNAGAADYAIELMSATSGNSWGHML